MSNAKTYDKKTAAFGGYVIQNIPSDLDEDAMDGWMNNPDALKKFLSGLKPPAVSEKQIPLFSVSATTNVKAVDGKKTKKCFVGSRYYPNRDADFDNWLLANQLKADACEITTLASLRGWTFTEAAVAILGIIGIDTNTNGTTIGKLLIEQGHTMTLVQVEEMVEATERDENTGMRTDGWGNFFFVENKNGSVSVGFVRRVERWFAIVDSLGHGARWRAGHRLLVRNLKDTSKLGL